MKKILSIILAISFILALLPTFASAAETTTDPTGTIEYTPATTLTDNTFLAVAYSAQNPPSLGISDGALHVTKMRADRISGIDYGKVSGYAQYAAVKMTIKTPGVYYISIKDGSSDETQKKVSTAPGIYFFKASADDTVTLWADKRGVTRTDYLGTSAPLAYFNFHTAPNGEYAPVIKDDGEKLAVVVPEAGDYIVGFSALPESWKRSSYALNTSANTVVERSDTTKTSSYSQQMHIAGIKLTPVSSMYFNDSIITSTTVYNEKDEKNVPIEPARWTITPASNWTIDSAISRESNYGTQTIKGNHIIVSLARSSTSYEPWSTYSTGNPNNDSKSKQSMIALKTTLPSEEGYYRIKVLGGKFERGTKAAFYIDNKFAGWYDCLDENKENPVLDSEETILNTVYLTPDENGEVPVIITSEGPVYSSSSVGPNLSCVVLSRISFEYLGKEKPLSATPDKIVVENAPETLEAEASAPISAYVLMKDGSKLHVSGMKRAIDHATTPLCPTTDSDNFLKITASDNLSLAADFEGRNIKNGVFTNPDGNATGTITANASGDATVTVSAKVDGVELEPVTVNVTVPSNEPPAPAEPGEEISGTVTFGFGAEPSHLENLVTAPGYTAGSPAQVPVGTKITLTARDSDNSAEKFKYWMISGRFYSTEKEITLTVARNTYVRAVYENEDEIAESGYTLVYYWDSEKILWNVQVFEGDTLPSAPGKADDITGMRFVGWYLDEETMLTKDTILTETVTNVVAKYEPLDTEYTVKVNGEENKGKYNSPVSVSAPEAFTYWKLGEEKLSFRRAFEFFNYGNAEITSVFDESAKAIPTVVIEKSLGAAFITYDTPAGYERIEAGIIFGPTAEITVNSANSKANAQKTAAFGQFTAKPYDNEQYARGYQIFKKDGIVRVIYTEAIEM